MQTDGLRVYSFDTKELGAYAGKYWANWEGAWFDLDEILARIKLLYGIKWDRKEILERFCFDFDDLTKTSNKTGTLIGFTVVNSKGKLSFYPYRQYGPVWEKGTKANIVAQDRIFAPANWTADVLWALIGGCTRMCVLSQSKTNGELTLVACMEDGKGVYIV